MLSHCFNVLSPLLPATRLFGFKVFIYRLLGVNLGKNVKIGNSIRLNFQGKVNIGDNVWLGRSADFTVPAGSKVTIGNSCDIAPYVKFMCGTHLIGSNQRRAGLGIAKDILIGNGCWIGTCVTVLGGATVGDGTVIAACSLLLPRKYPPNVLLAGIPARVVRHLND